MSDSEPKSDEKTGENATNDAVSKTEASKEKASRPKTKIVYDIDPRLSGGGRRSSLKFSTPRGNQKRESITYIPPKVEEEGPIIRGDYDTIKKELKDTGKLWEDPDFKAADRSLFRRRCIPPDVVWKRPHQLSKSPKFIVDGASRFDVRQGRLGDCWLLAAVASLSLHKEVFDYVVPPGQTFDKDDYCGVFRFRFWRYGEWVEEVIDDRLPTIDGELMYMSSTAEDEFWSALLEKAYAKMLGSYEALAGGSAGDAMEDFTGGVNEVIDLRGGPPKNLFKIMLQSQRQCSLMSCSIPADDNRRETALSNGLLLGHAYSITNVKQIQTSESGEFVQLVRIRNPWGNAAEWTGAWGDKSDEWQSIPASERDALGLTFSADGEFWMTVSDFAESFVKLEICHLGPESLDSDQLDGEPKPRWEACIENGTWKRRVNAGGCSNNKATFWTNPQYRVEVVDPDEDDDENMGTLIVGLTQKDAYKKESRGEDLPYIGYVIYEINERQAKEEKKPLDASFFKYRRSIAKATFINSREVCGRHKLVPGHYVIIPSTYHPDCEADFLLRIFSERPNDSEELDDETIMMTVNKKTELSPDEHKKDEELWKAFLDVSGEDQEVDAAELRQILNSALSRDDEIRFKEFSMETCRSMVALMDYNQSGMLGFEEFQILWNDFRQWKNVFKQHDKDKSGNFNSYELRMALNAVGFKVSNNVFNSLVMRFSTKKGAVLFDDFIMCCVRLKTVFETILSQATDDDGNALFDLDEFIQRIMYV